MQCRSILSAPLHSNGVRRGYVWTQKSFTIEVNQVRRCISNPNLSFPRDFAEVTPHYAAVGERRHINQPTF